MAALAEYKKLTERLTEIKNEIRCEVSGGNWVVSVYDHYTPIRFGVWLDEHNGYVDLTNQGLLSQDGILALGRYSKAELEPVVDRIKGLL